MKRILASFFAISFLVSAFVPAGMAQMTALQLDQSIEQFWFEESSIGGQAESLIIYGVEEVMNFVTDLDKDGQMNHDNLNRLLASMKAEVEDLAKLDQAGLEHALANGRIDKFLGFVEYLRRYGNELMVKEQLELRRIRAKWRLMARQHDRFRRDLRQAQLRVRRHVTEFYNATVQLRNELRSLDREQRQVVMDQIQEKAKDFRDKVREYRDRQYQDVRETYEQWCQSNPSDCQIDMEARRTRHALQLKYKKAARVIECKSNTSSGSCFRTVESYWREMGQSLVPTLESAELMVQYCRESITNQACLEQEQVVRAELQSLRQQIEALTGVIWQE